MTLVANHVLLPHPPDWINRPRGGRRWQTSTAGGITGAEDRQANARRAFRSLEYQLTFFSVVEREDFLPRLQAGLKSGRTAVPFWSRGQLLSANCSTTTLLFTGAFRFAIGDYVFFRDPDTGFSESILVDGVAGNTLTLHAAPSRTWAAGEMFWPLLFGRIIADNGRAITPEVLTLTVHFTEPAAAADAVISSSASCPVPSGASSPGMLYVCDGPPTANLLGWYLPSTSAPTSITDFSGNGWHLVQRRSIGGAGISTDQPVYVASGLNGKPILSWGDSTCQLASNSINVTTGGLTVAIVCRKVSEQSPTNNQLVGCTPFTTGWLRMTQGFPTPVSLRGFYGSATQVGNAEFPYNSWQVVTWSAGGSSSPSDTNKLKTNDVSLITTGASAPQTISEINLGMTRDGDVAELLVYDAQLTDVQLQRLRYYLSVKYAIAITV